MGFPVTVDTAAVLHLRCRKSDGTQSRRVSDPQRALCYSLERALYLAL